MEHVVTAVHHRGEHVADLHRIGAEIHLEHKVDRPWMTRALIHQHLAPALDRLGFLTTRVPADGSEQAHRSRWFIERLGFERTWGDEQFDYFMLGELPFKR